ncbi:MAG TPA: polysaccharide deacetylase family protein [Acidobacteriaceae bacterium]|nr:polysaccharide deacetylase family protein [Acidobacteriaceae bacterium]
MRPLLPLPAAATLALTGTAAYAAFHPQSQLFGRVLIAPRLPGQIALTFDDGPNPTATPELLDLLAARNVRATFFLIGRYALAQPELTRRIHAAGHLVGNHTMTHPKLPFCSHARIAAELRDGQCAIEDTVGASVRFFRPPHGARTPFVLRTARDLGLTTVNWNIITGDWVPVPATRISARITRGIARNQARGYASNIVLHDGSQTTPTADRSRTLAATATLLGSHPSASFVTLDAWSSQHPGRSGV